jgi:hypothetical protein
MSPKFLSRKALNQFLVLVVVLTDWDVPSCLCWKFTSRLGYETAQLGGATSDPDWAKSPDANTQSLELNSHHQGLVDVGLITQSFDMFEFCQAI